MAAKISEELHRLNSFITDAGGVTGGVIVIKVGE